MAADNYQTTLHPDYVAWKSGKMSASQFKALYGYDPTRFSEVQIRAALDAKENKKFANLLVRERGTGLQEGYSALDKVLSNPPFDPRMSSLHHMGVTKYLRRGQMVQNAAYAKARGDFQKGPYKLNFLYNPSSINIVYAANPNLWSPSELTANQAVVKTAFVGMQTMTFDLLFDRTYEVAYLNRPHPTLKDWGEALSAGVYADIRALERVVGIEGGNGAIQNIPIDVFFGHTEATYGPHAVNTAKVQRAFGFFGMVTSLNVTYTHFSHQMTPMRATVGISMSQVPRDAAAPGGVGEFVSEEEARGIEEGA